MEGKLENLGTVKISAEPAASETVYLVDVEKPVLKEGVIIKLIGQPDFPKSVGQWFPHRLPIAISVYSPTRLKITLASSDPKTCTQFMKFFIKWLDSRYIEALKEVAEFEPSILT